MTYSIVARDPESGDLGVATQSHFFAAGGLVCWAEPGVGAIASQAFADSAYGAMGLDLLRRGVAPAHALRALTEIDGKNGFRQVAVIDPNGVTAAHTGANCVPYAGHCSVDGVSAQGNMLASDGIWEAMVLAFRESRGDLAERLLVALEAAQALGGDIRGQQAAGIRIVAGDPVSRPWEGVRLDLRVEDHVQPLVELRRLITYKRAFDLVAGVIFAEGLMLGDFDESTAGEVDQAARRLNEAAAVLGNNAEPDLWRTILFARAGRGGEASAALTDALAKNPDLAEFIRRLPQAGFIASENPILTEL